MKIEIDDLEVLKKILQVNIPEDGKEALVKGDTINNTVEKALKNIREGADLTQTAFGFRGDVHMLITVSEENEPTAYLINLKTKQSVIEYNPDEKITLIKEVNIYETFIKGFRPISVKK